MKVEVTGGAYRLAEELIVDIMPDDPIGQTEVIPAGFCFDGPTASRLACLFLTHKDLVRGVRAACLHDWMCAHKADYTLAESTRALVDAWRADGLRRWKCALVYAAVYAYQWATARKEWRHV